MIIIIKDIGLPRIQMGKIGVWMDILKLDFLNEIF